MRLAEVKKALIAAAETDEQREEIITIIGELEVTFRHLHQLRQRRDAVGDVARALLLEILDLPVEINGEEETSKVT